MSQPPYPPGGAPGYPGGPTPGYGGPPQQGYGAYQNPGHGPPPQQGQVPSQPPGYGYQPQPGQVPPQQPGYDPPPQPGQGPPQQPGYAPQNFAAPPGSGQYPGASPLQQGAAPPQQPGAPAFAAPQGQVDAPTYSGSDIPDQDVDDNENAQPPLPSAPPSDMFTSLAGYENTHFGTDYLPPPPPYEPPPVQETPEQHFTQATAINEDQAREALLAFVGQHCCYGKKAAEDMNIKDIKPSSSFHYNMSSFTESRSTCWKFVPYTGQPIDGPQYGPAPLPWGIPAQPTKMFVPSEVHIEVPHTASVKPCHGCGAMGYVRCHRCFGRGRVRCSSCSGSGHRSVYRDGSHHRETCTWCHGSGRRRCNTCHGHGRVMCQLCKGQGQLKTYIELTVKWETHFDNHVVERSDLPDDLIVGSLGTDVFSQELPRVWPITAFPDPDVTAGSQRLVEAHSRNWPSKRILMQRHVLRAVPVSEVHYKWKETSTRYWVYGHDHQVHAPDYPQQCCCGCTLI